MPRRLLIALIAAASLAAPARAQAIELTLVTTGPGTVQIEPSGLLRRCTGATCVFDFAAGQTVALKASTTTPGANLARWLGACTGNAPTCTVTLARSQRVTARFTPVE